MKAFTSSCSKAIFQTLGPFSPRVYLRVSDRPQLCFSLRSINDRKGCNLCLLKLVGKKGSLYPVLAVPPKEQVDLETSEPQAQQIDQIDDSKFVRVAFRLQKNCSFGEQFLIVGDDPILGSWDPLDALPMTWSEGHVWTVDVDMPAGKSIQFKFILKGKTGNVIWQPGTDRMIHTWETTNRITVCEDWENEELQKIKEEPYADQVQNIIEEDQVAQPNEEPQVDSEVSNFTETLDNPQEGLDSNPSELSAIEDIQIHEEEKPLTEPVMQQVTGNSIPSSVEKPLAIVAENIEDIQIHEKEKPLAEPVMQQVTGNSISSSTEKPMAFVAENISSSEDLIKGTSHKSDKKNILQPSEESADSLGNDDIIHDLGINGSPASLKNQEKTVVESNLFDFEGGSVLVPDLIVPPTVPNDEAGQGEVQEVTTVNTSVGAFETQDQIIPELSKEQENDDATPQEIDATINNEKLLYNEHDEDQSHLSLEMKDRPNYQSDDGNPLQNDIKWGQETVKKFLTILGFL